MDILANNGSGKNCLIFEGSMTCKTALDIENTDYQYHARISIDRC